MKLLLDENLSRRLVTTLKEYYPETTQIALLGFNGKTDNDIWEFAKENDYAIVTQDADFHEKSILLGGPPFIIWLRCGNQPRRIIAKKLIDNHIKIKEAAADKSIWCVAVF